MSLHQAALLSDTPENYVGVASLAACTSSQCINQTQRYHYTCFTENDGDDVWSCECGHCNDRTENLLYIESGSQLYSDNEDANDEGICSLCDIGTHHLVFAASQIHRATTTRATNRRFVTTTWNDGTH